MSILSKAQTDSTKAPTSSTSYTIYFDGYYKNDFSKQSTNNKTSFTNSDKSFELGMISAKAGRSISWDPEKEMILDDEGASALLKRGYRAPWIYPIVWLNKSNNII